ncbi:MAG TPA: prolyl oligopeptidase family serine peptidase [Gemmataceae bacterium]|nr:prolyl oligopeptidase family serine peptidase [Gemmataceae bacterium]
MKPLAALIAGAVLAAAPLTAHAEPKEGSLDLLEKKTYTDADGKKLLYRLLQPMTVDPKRRYPLVVFLHGAGERGDDNEKQLVHGVPEFLKPENRTQYPCFLIAPQCPANEKWVDVDWGAETTVQPEKPSESMRLVLALIDQMQKDDPIDAKRIYITGLSMGGYGTWDAIARRPELFAAAVPICGGGDENTAPKIASIPIWAFHGSKDPAVKVSRTLGMIDALRKAGGDPGCTIYPGEGHASWVPAYRDAAMMKWLFAQKKQ